jgi:hypothetical protein
VRVCANAAVALRSFWSLGVNFAPRRQICFQKLASGGAASRPPQDQTIAGSNPAGLLGYDDLLYRNAVVVVLSIKCIVIACEKFSDVDL